MKTISANDYKLIKSLVKLSQESMRSTLATYLEKKYEMVYKKKEFLMAIGDIPIALVAHMDTVFDSTPVDIFYDSTQNVMWSPQGLGADDRAGIFAILKILQAGFKPTVIFTTDEESGALGASALVAHFKKAPTDLNYIVQLDRRGTNDCVFYDCENTMFTDYIETFGFVEKYGTFSDISVICPAWGVAGVNLSVGYEDEHSYIERLYLTALFSTINKVKNMLKEEVIPKFEYIESLKIFKSPYTWFPEEQYACANCHQAFSEYDMIQVERTNGETVYYCPDCCVDNVEWCLSCQRPFESSGKGTCYCPDCVNKIGGGNKKWNSKKSKNNLTV